jgi:hypothetical protein
MRKRVAALGLGWFFLTIFMLGAPPLAADEAGELKARALESLKAELGAWTSHWDWLGEDGAISGTMDGVENYEFVIPDAVLMNTNTILGESPSVSKSLMFYNPVHEKIFFISVGPTGDHWILSKDVGSNVLVSDPHLLPDGRMLMIRFTTVEETPDAKTILMEASLDEGETWKPRFYQYMARAGANESGRGE